MSARSRLLARLLAPADLAGLVAFRVLLGALLLVDLARYELAGWVDEHYLEPTFLFTYPGFGWVHPLPGPWMHVLFVALMGAALAVVVGWRHRLAAWALTVGQAYLFLLAATRYLNHAYLLIVLTGLLACSPAHRGLSLDARRRPELRRGWAPAGAQWLLRAQLGIVYVFGGLAKIDADWLAGEPVRGWLAARAHTAPPWIGEWLSSEAAVGLVVQGGLWFDLLVTPALLWRRTRVVAVLASVAFHLSNAWLFSIGIFPWVMLAATTLFLEPSWPRRLPWIGSWIDARLGPRPSPAPVEPPPPRARVWLGLAGAWLVAQVVLPLRHHLYPGDVAWTEEGHYLAWRMKLRTKDGAARFVVRAPSTNETWVVDPADELTGYQVHKMVGKPDLVLRYAHHLAERWRSERGLEVEVRAQVNVSLNRRMRRPLVDPTVDLAKVEDSLGAAAWIMPGPEDPVPGGRQR